VAQDEVHRESWELPAWQGVPPQVPLAQSSLPVLAQRVSPRKPRV
jgi:hypothetical protein